MASASPVSASLISQCGSGAAIANCRGQLADGDDVAVVLVVVSGRPGGAVVRRRRRGFRCWHGLRRGCGVAALSEGGEQAVRGVCQQGAAGGEELRVAVYLPQVLVCGYPLGFEHARVLLLDFPQVGGRVVVADRPVRPGCEEAEVGQGVDLGPAHLFVVEAFLGEDVVLVELVEVPVHAQRQGQAVDQVLCPAEAGHYVQQRVEAGADAPPVEVAGFQLEASPPPLHLSDQPVDSAVF